MRIVEVTAEGCETVAIGVWAFKSAASLSLRNMSGIWEDEKIFAPASLGDENKTNFDEAGPISPPRSGCTAMLLVNQDMG